MVKVKVPDKPDVVSFEAFNQAFNEYQVSMRKELRKAILARIHTASFKEILGLRVAADIVWNEDEAEGADGGLL